MGRDGLTALVRIAVVDIAALGTVQLQDALLRLVRYAHLLAAQVIRCSSWGNGKDLPEARPGPYRSIEGIPRSLCG